MILQLQKKDLDECVTVIRSSFLTVADKFGFNEKNAPRYTPFSISAEVLEEMMKQNIPMFAYYDDNNGKILGYYSLKLQNTGECDLRNLCILPAFRRRGYGSSLFWHAVRIGQQGGCKRMKLSVVEEDTEVREWYEKLGAKHIGTQKYDFFPFTCGYMEVDLTTVKPKSIFKKRSDRFRG